jgi:hypothetical protein
MSRRCALGSLVVALAVVCGCERVPSRADASNYLIIDVLSDRDACRVQKIEMPCAEVSDYVSVTLKVQPDQQVMVGALCFERDGGKARSIAADLKRAGYMRVGVAGFINEPPPGRGC